MKRVISLLVAMTLCFSLTACSGSSGKKGSSADTSGTKSEEASSSADSAATEQTLAPGEPSSTGDGYAPEEDVLRLIKWIDDGYADGLSYEEVRDFIGVDGEDNGNSGPNSMTQLGDHYFVWYADASHFINVCFRGNDETGKFELAQWNTSGFDSSEWADIDLTEWLAANANTDTGSVTLSMTEYYDETVVKVTADVPQGNWYCEASGEKAYFYNVPDKDSQDSASPRIQVALEKTVDVFDNHKDSFENYEEIEGRTIGGIEMAGRKYEYVGMDWIEYVGQMDDESAISVKISDVEIGAGTEGAAILDSMTFSK